jgi:hypothetical protein
VLVRHRRGIDEEGIWDAVAYACRYGKQDADTVMAWTSAKLDRFNQAIGKIVIEENKPRKE